MLQHDKIATIKVITMLQHDKIATIKVITMLQHDKIATIKVITMLKYLRKNLKTTQIKSNVKATRESHISYMNCFDGAT